MPNIHLDKNDPLYGLKSGSWSKWGGSMGGLVKEELPEWTCQACGKRQPKGLPAFMFQFVPREFIRICSRCHNVSKERNITVFYELKVIVAKKRPIGFY